MHFGEKKFLPLSVSTFATLASCWVCAATLRTDTSSVGLFLLLTCIQSILNTVFLFFYILSFRYSYRFTSPCIPLIVIFSNVSLFILCQDIGADPFPILDKYVSSSATLFCELSIFLFIIGYGLFAENSSTSRCKSYIILSLIGSFCATYFNTVTITPDRCINNSMTTTLYYTLSAVAVCVFVILALTEPPGPIVIRDICVILITIVATLNFSQNPALKTIASFCLSFCIVFVIILSRKNSIML